MKNSSVKKSHIIIFCVALFITMIFALFYFLPPVIEEKTPEWRFKDITDQFYETQYGYAIQEVAVHSSANPQVSFTIYISFESLNMDEMHKLGCDAKEVLDRDFREPTKRHNANSRDIYLAVVSESSAMLEQYQIWNFYRKGDYSEILGGFKWTEEFKSK